MTASSAPLQPTLSVAICTYNGARFIRQQLDSILGQSELPDEIVLSDDGSRDDTVAIARAVLAHASMPVRVEQRTHPVGVTRNFESAIRRCEADLIMLADQDDIWHPDRVSRTKEYFRFHDDLTLLFGDATLVDETGRGLGDSLFSRLPVTAAERRQVHEGNAFSVLLRRNIATGATVTFRRSLLKVALPIPDSWVHDEWLAIVSSVAGSVDLLEEPLIDYRQHSGNEIGVQRATAPRKLRAVFGSRGDRNRRLATRSRALAERFGSVPGTFGDEAIQSARDKARGERARMELPRQRVRRIRQIRKLNAEGWYEVFASQGRLDMLRDLLQKHDREAHD